MRINAKLLLLSFCLVLSHYSYTQTINAAKSEVNISVSNMGFNTVKGTLDGMIGRIEFDHLNPTQALFNACIDATSIDTNNKMRDKDLRSEAFLNTKDYPTICFESESIRRISTGFSANGKLTLRGVTKSIEIPFTYQNNTFVGSTTLNRFDFNIGEDSGTFMVGETIEIEIICVISN